MGTRWHQRIILPSFGWNAKKKKKLTRLERISFWMLWEWVSRVHFSNVYVSSRLTKLTSIENYTDYTNLDTLEFFHKIDSTSFYRDTPSFAWTCLSESLRFSTWGGFITYTMYHIFVYPYFGSCLTNSTRLIDVCPLQRVQIRKFICLLTVIDRVA